MALVNCTFLLKRNHIRLFIVLSSFLLLLPSQSLGQTSPGLTTDQVMFSKEVDGMEIVFITNFRMKTGAGGLGGINLLLTFEEINGGVLRDYVILDGKKYYHTSFDGSVSKEQSTELRELWFNVKVIHASVKVKFSGVKETEQSKTAFKPGSTESFYVYATVKDKSLISLDDVQITSVYLDGADKVKEKIRFLEKAIKENEAKKQKEADDKKKAEELAKKNREKEDEQNVSSGNNKKDNSEEVQNKGSNINNPSSSYSQNGQDVENQNQTSNADEAKKLNQQAQDLAMQGDIEGAQNLANQANSLDPTAGNSTVTKQLIQQNRAIRDSKLTAEAWSKGIDLGVNTLISLFQPVNLNLIRSAETPEEAQIGYEQVRNDIEQKKQIADQNFNTFYNQNLANIKASKSSAEAKANMWVGLAGVAGHMASQAKANNDLKKAYKEKKDKFDEFKSELLARHQKNKETYLQSAANEPKEALEEYYLDMYEFHGCGISSIEQNFSYESSDWSKINNYCSKPSKSYGTNNIDYKDVVRRKKSLAKEYSDKSELFMNAARYYANKRVVEDKNDPDGYLIRAELSDDVIGRMGDVLIASQLSTDRKDIQDLKVQTIDQFKAEFFSAIDNHNINFVSKSIDNKLHSLAISPKNESPVVYCVKTNNDVMLNLLIDKLTELQNSLTLSNILYLAVVENADKCITELLKRKVADELTDQAPAFQLVIEFGNEKAAIAFLKNKKDPRPTLRYFNELGSLNNVEKTLRYITIAGIELDDSELIDLAKSKKPAIEKEAFDQEDTYLSYSVRMNSIEAFNALIKDNKAAHLSTNLNGEDLLQIALRSNSFKIIKSLKVLGADLSKLSNNVELIFSTTNIEMLEAYQSIGVNINIQNKDGNSIFHLAALNNDLSYFNSNLNPDYSIKNNNGYGIIHLAALKRNDQLIRLLVKRGADINAAGPYDWRPLHFASRENDYNLSQTLLTLGANKKVKDQWNRTPFKVAKERGYDGLKQLLR